MPPAKRTTSGRPRKPPTRRGTAKLSDVARHIVQPEGIVSTGWPAVERTCGKLGLSFDRWQDGAGRLILAKNADGLYAADTVVISIPRQVGKTFLIGAIVFALCLIHPGLTVIWTAHRFKTAAEVFGSLSAMARQPKIAVHVAQIFRSGDDKSIHFTNGSRVLFGARERGFGRGFADVDVLVMDEGQILTEATVEDMVPATNVAANPLIIYIGTPPRPKDPGEVFRNFRTEALSGGSTDVLYIELSADPSTDPLEREEWARFNPSYPHRTTSRAMLRMHKNLGADAFEREARGIWDEMVRGTITVTAWADRRDPDARIESGEHFAIDVAPDQSRACIAVAGKTTTGLVGVEITHRGGLIDYREGIEWVVARCVEIREARGRLTVSIASGSAAMVLKPDLEAAGVEVDVVPGSEVSAACGLLYALVQSKGAVHSGQPDLAEAIAASRRDREDGEGQWRWHRRRSGVDITPTYAVSLALWRAATEPASVYEERGLVTL